MNGITFFAVIIFLNFKLAIFERQSKELCKQCKIHETCVLNEKNLRLECTPTGDYCNYGAPRTDSNQSVIACGESKDCFDSSNGPISTWCDLEKHFCCRTNRTKRIKWYCPDTITPLYGEAKCSNSDPRFEFSGKCDQSGGICYHGFCCPPRVNNLGRMVIGNSTYMTNIDCDPSKSVDPQFLFMFCSARSKKLWAIGKRDVNGDDIVSRWIPCEFNSDCGASSVCLKEEMRRYRCYVDPTIRVSSIMIVLHLSSMFLFPILILAAIIFFLIRDFD